MRKLVFLLIVAVALTGCQTIPSATQADRERTIPVASAKAFDAIKGYFFSKSIEITSGNKESGFLKGQLQADFNPLTASIVQAHKGMFRYYNVSFLEKDGQTKVLVKITIGYGDNFTSPSEVNQPEYDAFWQGLEANL